MLERAASGKGVGNLNRQMLARTPRIASTQERLPIDYHFPPREMVKLASAMLIHLLGISQTANATTGPAPVERCLTTTVEIPATFLSLRVAVPRSRGPGGTAMRGENRESDRW